MAASLSHILLLGSVFFASHAPGQSVQRALRHGELKSMHKIMDSDDDGRVSMLEGLAYIRGHRRKVSDQSVRQILADMDTNNDGQLDLQEFKKDLVNFKMEDTAKEDAVIRFGSFDDNEDEHLDMGEMAVFFNWWLGFRPSDTNEDGKLTFKEFRRGVMKKKGAKPKSGPSEEDKAVFDGLDVDKDKRLSLKEYLAYKTGTYAAEEALRKLFNIADKDADKLLSRDELIEARSGMAGTSAHYHVWDWAKHEGVLEEEGEL